MHAATHIELTCQRLELIPIISTAASLFHLFAKYVYRVAPHSPYGQYLHYRSVSFYLWNLIPLVPLIDAIFMNIFGYSFRRLFDKQLVLEGIIQGKIASSSLVSEFGLDGHQMLIQALKDINTQKWLKEIELGELKDKQTALTLLKIDPQVYRKLSEELRHDLAIIRALLKQGDIYILEIPDAIKNDINFITSLESASFNAFKFLTVHYSRTDQICDDEEQMRKLIATDPSALMRASSRLRADYELVMQAVQKDGRNLLFASVEVLPNSGDLAIAHAAITQNPFAIRFVSTYLELVPLFSVQNLKSIKKELILFAVTQNGLALGSVGFLYQDDVEVVKAAVKQNGLALQFASAKLRADPCIYVAACANNPDAKQFISNEQQTAPLPIVSSSI